MVHKGEHSKLKMYIEQNENVIINNLATLASPIIPGFYWKLISIFEGNE